MSGLGAEKGICFFGFNTCILYRFFKPSMKPSRFLFAFLLLVSTTFGVCAQNQVDAEGRKQGPWTVRGSETHLPGYAPDAIVEEGTYKDNRKTGLWKTYFPEGMPKNEITFENGRPKGPYTTYYKNGQIQEQGNWNLTKNYGNFKRYYENGNVQQDFTFNESGKRQGPQKYYHENGQLMIEGNWNGGKETGEVKEYYATGELKSVKVFNDGAYDAAQTKTFESQKLAEEPKVEPEPVKDEQNQVKKTVVVAKAEEKPNVGFFDGNGFHTLYNKNKQITQKGEFKNGRLMDGKWYKYDRDGILTNIEIYQNGVYVGEGVIDKSMQ